MAHRLGARRSAKRVTGSIAALSFAGLATVAILPGCIGPLCTNDNYECFDRVVAKQPATQGMVSWNGVDRPLIIGNTDTPPSDGSCIAFIEPAAATSIATDDPSLFDQVQVECVDGQTMFLATLTLLDLRNAEVGSKSLPQQAGGQLGPLGASSACSFEGNADLVVDVSKGGTHDYPELVKADFQKAFHVHMSGSDTLGSCGSSSPSFDVSLSFDLGPSYFKSGATRTCSSSAC